MKKGGVEQKRGKERRRKKGEEAANNKGKWRERGQKWGETSVRGERNKGERTWGGRGKTE